MNKLALLAAVALFLTACGNEFEVEAVNNSSYPVTFSVEYDKSPNITLPPGQRYFDQPKAGALVSYTSSPLKVSCKGDWDGNNRAKYIFYDTTPVNLDVNNSTELEIVLSANGYMEPVLIKPNTPPENKANWLYIPSLEGFFAPRIVPELKFSVDSDMPVTISESYNKETKTMNVDIR